jgi:hypothetical protein
VVSEGHVEKKQTRRRRRRGKKKKKKKKTMKERRRRRTRTTTTTTTTKRKRKRKRKRRLPNASSTAVRHQRRVYKVAGMHWTISATILMTWGVILMTRMLVVRIRILHLLLAPGHPPHPTSLSLSRALSFSSLSDVSMCLLIRSHRGRVVCQEEARPEAKKEGGQVLIRASGGVWGGQGDLGHVWILPAPAKGHCFSLRITHAASC